MKVAILFKGISHIKQYTHWTGKKFGIDFRDNIDNVKKCLIDPLERKSVYYTTYEHNYLDELADNLKPRKINILKNNDFFRKQYVLKQMLNVLELIDNKTYDIYILTRFDINIEYDINIILNKINHDKIWFLCKAEDSDKTKTFNDDSFIIIPKIHLDIFIETIKELIEENKVLGHHMLCQKLPDISDFIYNETHLIVNSRPYIKFNREIDYNLSNPIEYNKLTKYPYMSYKINNVKLLFIYSNIFQVSGSGKFMINFKEKTTVLITSGKDICINGNIYLKNDTIDLYSINLELNDNIIRFEVKDIKVHFLSFYTEGPPNDKCLNMTNVMNKYLTLLNPYIDTYDIYTPRRLKENDETKDLVSEYKTQNPYNPGVHNIGYLKWKPYIILQKIKEVNDGEIIYYRDSNIIKYPVMTNGIHETKNLINLVLKDVDIFVPTENYPELKMKYNVKKEIFNEIGEYNDDYLEEFMFNSSILICRKTPKVVEILEKWLHYCKNDRLLTYDITIRQHKEYKWNVQEQSILNVILKSENITGKYSLNYRDFSFNKLTKVPRIAVLIIGELRTFDNKDLISHNNKNLFDKYNCDVFISTWDNRGYSFNHGNIINRNRHNENINENMIKSVYKRCKKINIENHKKWVDDLPKEYKNIYDKGLYNGDILSPSTAFEQLYKLKNVNDLKNEYEKEFNFNYDIVIKFRPDMCLIESIDHEYINNFCKINNTFNKLYHLNPPSIYDPNRIYDIFFISNSQNMNIISESYENILKLINDPFDNGLDKVNACRLLYLQAIKNNIIVEDIPYCYGDIYRGEDFNEYVEKINDYNSVNKRIENKKEIVHGIVRGSIKNLKLKKFGRLYIKI
jgi:hypothetical protein